MLHLISMSFFLTTGAAVLMILWAMIAENADKIVAALQMRDPAPFVPAPTAARVRKPAAPVLIRTEMQWRAAA